MKKVIMCFLITGIAVLLHSPTKAQSEYGYCGTTPYGYGCEAQSYYNMQEGSTSWYVNSSSGNFHWAYELTLENGGYGYVWIQGIIPVDYKYGPYYTNQSSSSYVGTSPTWIDAEVVVLKGSCSVAVYW